MAVQNTMPCFLTGKNVTFEKTDKYCYDIEVAGNKVFVMLCSKCFSGKENLAKIPQHIIRGLIANNKFPDRHIFHLSERTQPHQEREIDLFSFLQSASYPRTPKEKIDNLLLNLFNKQNTDGEELSIKIQDESIWMKNYFKTISECIYYFDGLKNEELIFYQHINQPKEFAVRLTHKGLNKAIQLSDEGISSNKCFVAMAFDDTTKPYREAIRKSITNTGFQAVLIDEVHIESDKTIPDKIFTGIRQSKFCIADFSLHRNGVYFESGFALGLGKPVIYLCEKEQMKEAHFDIKQLQHIIYSSPEELENKLTQKIEAWIK